MKLFVIDRTPTGFQVKGTGGFWFVVAFWVVAGFGVHALDRLLFG